VDDLVTEADSDEGAFELYLTAKRLMSEGGFNLQKWKMNSPTLMSKIESHEGLSESQNSDSGTLVTHIDQGYLGCTGITTLTSF